MLRFIDPMYKQLVCSCVLFLALSSAFANNLSELSNQMVASVNLCTDQILLELLPEERIESLSFLAADKQYSPQWKKAQNKPSNRAQLEELFLLKSSTILVSPYSKELVKSTLKKINKKVVSFTSPHSIESLQENIVKLSDELNISDQSHAINQRLSKIIEKKNSKKTQQKSKRALILGAGGYAIGKQAIEHELLIAAGFSNVTADMGIKYSTVLSLEGIIFLQPDVIFLTDNAKNKSSASQRLLNHPVLKVGLKNTKFIKNSRAFSACSPSSIFERLRFLEKAYATLVV